jgi:hypothetical protein
MHEQVASSLILGNHSGTFFIIEMAGLLRKAGECFFEGGNGREICWYKVAGATNEVAWHN